jgi:hypothetical protein
MRVLLKCSAPICGIIHAHLPLFPIINSRVEVSDKCTSTPFYPEVVMVSVFMDFIPQLPKEGSYNGAIMVVERLYKYEALTPTKSPCLRKTIVALFYKHIVKYWGLLLNIVLDRDTRFVDLFSIDLFKLIRTKTMMITIDPSQTYKQIERINVLFEEYLWHFVYTDQWIGQDYRM